MTIAGRSLTQNSPIKGEAEQKTVIIRGMACVLEKRICLGGCDKEFWCCPGSTAEHARSDCKFVCNVPIDQIPEFIMRRYDQYANSKDFEQEKQAYSRQLFSRTSVKTKPPPRGPKPKPKPIPKDQDPKYLRQIRRWNTAITRAKSIIQRKERLPNFRESVAAIANAVVTNKKNFSIKCFSALVGLDRKTLQSWIHVKMDVINRIEVYDGNFLAARKTREFVRQNPDQVSDLNVIFMQEVKKCRMKKEDGSPEKGRSTGSSNGANHGRARIYRMKIRIKFAS